MTRVPDEYIVSLQGKKFILFPGLLELAHQDGLSFNSTEIIQIPNDNNGNAAIVKAVVRTSKGEFSGIGDANPKNVTTKIIPHILRMAETRALARALRFATNVNMTAFEELGADIEAPEEAPAPVQKQQRQPQTQPQAKQTNLKVLPEPKNSDSVVPMTDEQGKRVQFICKQIGMDSATLQTTITAKYGHGWKHLTKQEANELIDQLSEFLEDAV